MTYAYDDRRHDHDDPGEPVCDVCREVCGGACLECHCGAPATVEHLGHWWCEPCAADAGWCPSTAMQLDAAE